MASVSRSKTAVPGLPPEFVHRPALLTALDRGEDRALTLVCAPPGYGKTLLLADWIRSRDVAVRLGHAGRGGRRPAATLDRGAGGAAGLPGRAGVEPAAQSRRAPDDRRRRLPHRRARVRSRPSRRDSGWSSTTPTTSGARRPCRVCSSSSGTGRAPSAWSWPAGSTPRCPSRGCAWRSGSASCAPSSSASRPTETATLADLCGLRPGPRRRPRCSTTRTDGWVAGHPARRDAAARPPRARPLPRRLLRRRAPGGRLPRRRGVRAHLRRGGRPAPADEHHRSGPGGAGRGAVRPGRRRGRARRPRAQHGPRRRVRGAPHASSASRS